MKIVTTTVDEYQLTTSCDSAKGSVSSTSTGINKYSLSATANSGYSFDYWTKGTDETQLTGNPLEVALEADTTYTAHFRECYQPTVVSSDEQYGTVSAEQLHDDTWKLTATPKSDGRFLYWNKENFASPLAGNSLTVTLTEAENNIKYTANFRKIYQATVESEDTAKGSVYAEHRSDDIWMLYATPAEGYAFSNWYDTTAEKVAGYSASYQANLEKDTHYIGRFVRASLTLQDGAKLRQTSIRNDMLIGNSSQANPPVGSRAGLYIPFVITGSLTKAKMQFCVYEGTDTSGKLLADRTITDLNTIASGSERTACLILDPLPELTQVTVVISIRMDNGTDLTDQKTYTVSTAASQVNNDFQYLTSPYVSGGTGGYTQDAGPNVSGVYAELDTSTQDATLYFHGKNGVYTWDDSGVLDLADMSSGLPKVDGGFAGVFAMGSDGADGLIAAVEINPVAISSVTTPGYDASSWSKTMKGSHFLYHWDGSSWSRIDNSCFSNYNRNAGIPQYDQPDQPTQTTLKDLTALIVSADDIWTNLYHWDGSKWSAHDYSFISLNNTLSADGTRTYTGYSDDGKFYTYNAKTKTWTEGEAPVTPEITDNNMELLGQAWDGSYYAATPGRIHKANNYYKGSDIYKWSDDQWVYQVMSEFNDPDDDPLDTKIRIRPDEINGMSTPLDGVSVMYGSRSFGSIYMYADEVSITFDANGGELRNGTTSSIIGTMFSQVDSTLVPSATSTTGSFLGWCYDEEGDLPWNADTARFPVSNITLYAKWGEKDTDSEMAYHRKAALASLEKQFNKYKKTDYNETNWAALVAAYEKGIEDINAALPAEGTYIENNIIAALNEAIAAMQAIPADRVGKIDVVVSMDAQTLSLGYLIKPTLVTIDDRTQASVVIAELIQDMVQEKYGIEGEGLTTQIKGEVDGVYPFTMTGTVSEGFYLAQVYCPEQSSVTEGAIPDYIIQDTQTRNYDPIDYSDNTGKYLGEFDYYTMSGWMYSISSQYDDDLPVFPGVGASGWQLSDGEVMRWQFTVTGYGADLNADNTNWGGSSITGNSGDKTALTYMIAQLRSVYGDDLLESNETYVDIFDNVLCDPLATQEALDAAVGKKTQIEEELADAYAAKAVKQLIEEIGLPQNVTLESKAAIEAARNAYDALTDAQKTVFGKQYSSALSNLEAAEAKYQQLVAQAEQEEIDRAAANGVIDLIEAIGGVDSVTRSSGPVIRKARNAYDALTEAQKALVSNYDVLLACEKAYNELPEPVIPVTPARPSTPSKPSEPTVSFTDISGHWASDAIEYAVANGLMNGTGNGKFEPNANTTRGMIVTILARLEGVDTTKGSTWYEAGRQWAMANGISDGTNMEGSMTREQLATILFRYAKMKGYNVSKTAALTAFSDADQVSSYAVEAMQWATAEGLVQGSDGKLDPNGTATRAQVATILMRFMEKYTK